MVIKKSIHVFLSAKVKDNIAQLVLSEILGHCWKTITFKNIWDSGNVSFEKHNLEIVLLLVRWLHPKLFDPDVRFESWQANLQCKHVQSWEVVSHLQNVSGVFLFHDFSSTNKYNTDYYLILQMSDVEWIFLLPPLSLLKFFWEYFILSSF